MKRRTFTRDLLASGLGALGFGVGCSTRVPVHPTPPPGPVPNPVAVHPEDSGIEQIIIVTLENRSFDHFLGWLPGGAGIPSGLSYQDASGAVHAVHSLSGDYTGCGHPIPND